MRILPALLIAAALPLRPADPYRGWTVYGGGPDSIRYSTLDQINRGNVARLQVAWTYDTGDAFDESEMECNPIVVNGVLYATTPKLRLIALDAATGKLRWSFDPRQRQESFGKARNRGVTYWADGRRPAHLLRRQPLAVRPGRAHRRPHPAFGDDGRVDLRQGLGRPPEEMSISATTPASSTRTC